MIKLPILEQNLRFYHSNFHNGGRGPFNRGVGGDSSGEQHVMQTKQINVIFISVQKQTKLKN